MADTSLWSAVRIGAIYAGTVIGAGFASGQELLQFFAAYGGSGLAGAALAGGLMAWLGATMLHLGRRIRAAGYQDLIYRLCGPHAGAVLAFAIVLFLFCCLAIMLAGMATIGRDYFGCPYLFCLAGAALLAALTVLGGMRGITIANIAVTPLLAAAVAGVAAAAIVHHLPGPELLAVPAPGISPPVPWWPLAAFLYVSYNVALSATVLAPLGSGSPRRAARTLGGIIGGLTIAVLAVLGTAAILLHLPAALEQELPVLYIAGLQEYHGRPFLAIILLAAMYTTAIASLYGCAAKLAIAARSGFTLTVLTAAAAAAAAGVLGFSFLVGTVFPLFGWVTALFTARLVWYAVSGR